MKHEAIETTAAVQVHLPVSGMHCGGCAARLQRALDTVPGLESVNVELALERAHFEACDADAIRSAASTVTGNGFSVGTERIALDIGGMHCGNCAGRIETALMALPGVLSASVNPASESGIVEIAAGSLSLRDLVAAVEAIGYQANPRSQGADQHAEADAARDRSVRNDLLLLIGAAVLTAPLVLPMILMPFGVMFHLAGWWQFALALPVQIFVGARFYKGAYSALKNGAANMDVLVALGTSAAFFHSLWQVLQGESGMLYFEASAVVLTLVLAGKFLEARAKRSASAAVRALMDLRPRTAIKLDAKGNESEISTDMLMKGDRVLVRPGGRIPADGVILSGVSEFDESLITGESVPVTRGEGASVIEGAINGTGRIELEVGAVGHDTTLARVIRLVEQAQAGKAPVQRLVDRIAAVFVPVVLVIALLTLTGWLVTGAAFGEALSAAVAVLVIACPCALGLATPAALVAGTGAAAKHGILIKDIDALEHLAKIDLVVFDKTGTLTAGHPAVTSEFAVAGEPDKLVTLAANILASSEHPLSKAIVAYSGSVPANDVTDFRNVPGAGVTAIIDGKAAMIGRPDWLADAEIDLSPLAEALSNIENNAETPVAVAIGGNALGIFGLSDELRPGAGAAVAQLKAAGVESVLMSGDALSVARKIGGVAGIENIAAGMKPEDKAREVARFGREGRHPAMVGDGVNDAAALAAADVGIAMGSGTDVAMETATVTLMRSDPRLVPAAREIALRTARTIRQNLFWAFAYNVIGIPLAAFGMLSPAFAGAAMALSSVSVVGNALRLTRWRADIED